MLTKKILIVDDSALMRRVVCDIISTDSRFEVEDMARNGLDALELLSKKSYDAVILDVNMPRMNGLELLKALQEKGISARVMMFSTQTSDGARETIEALELGALDFVQKPEGVIGGADDRFRTRFLQILSVVARPYGVPRHTAYDKSLTSASSDALARTKATSEQLKALTGKAGQTDKPSLKPSVSVSGEKIVAIASSTGGPKALQQVIPKLPANLNAPVLLVQHMPAGFTKSLAERLDQLSEIHVKEAEDGERIEKGWVYIAEGGKHMKLSKSGSNYRIYYTDEPHREGVKPCANYMYESLCDSDYAQICCTVLTGMGADGTEGIKNLSAKKKLHVIAQSEETCAVYGMPKSIAATGLVNELLPLEDVAAAITKNVGCK